MIKIFKRIFHIHKWMFCTREQGLVTYSFKVCFKCGKVYVDYMNIPNVDTIINRKFGNIEDFEIFITYLKNYSVKYDDVEHGQI